jgi:excisionase family DNA binding protein
MAEIITRKEAAEFLRLSVHTLDYLVRTSQIPYHRIGKRLIRFDRERLRSWFDEREGIEVRYNK